MTGAPTLVAVLLAGAVASGCGEDRPPGPGVVTRWEARSLADGSLVGWTPGSGPVVLNIWATWCEPCRREMASLEVAHRELAAKGIRVVGVSVDRDVLLAREYVRRTGLTFTNLSDPEQALARDLLGVRRLPTTLAIGADGRVRWREESARDWSEPRRLAWVAETVAAR